MPAEEMDVMKYLICGRCQRGFAAPQGGAENQCECLREAHLCKCHVQCDAYSVMEVKDARC